MSEAPSIVTLEQRAERVGVTPGLGRAAWVLSQWASEVAGVPLRFADRYSRDWRCRDCDRVGADHGPVEVMHPSGRDDAPAALGGLVGPLCPACALGRVRGDNWEADDG